MNKYCNKKKTTPQKPRMLKMTNYVHVYEINDWKHEYNKIYNCSVLLDDIKVY